jgi:HEAT repeat protein
MFAAINSLAAMNQDDADLALKNFYSTLTENYVKMQVLQAVAANGSVSARAIIRIGLKDANEYVRKAAVQSLSFSPDEAEAVKDLTDTLRVETNESIRGHALTALSNFSSTAAVAAAGTELGNKSNSKEHRLRAARALQHMNTKQSRDLIEKYRNDPQISDGLKAIPKAGK